MNKSNASPENTEVTPSKKKLKQARLPFVVVSDVSPKTDTLPSRKRKLSVPETEPVTKVGKLSEKSEISDDLIVLSDDESNRVSSQNKRDKCLNPYVKLVDAARKKKLQKSKGQKTSKSKSSKKQTKSAKEKPLSEKNGDSSECGDVEMVEVDVIIHETEEEIFENNPNKLGNCNKEEENRKKSPMKEITSKELPEDTSKDNRTTESVDNIPKVIEKKNNIESEVICLEDSNNSVDVNMSKKVNPESESIKQDKISKDPKEQSDKLDNTRNNPKAMDKQILKRSSQNKPNTDGADKSESTSAIIKEQEPSQTKHTLKNNKANENKINNLASATTNKNNSQMESDSDVEMVEPNDKQTTLVEKTNAKSTLEETNSNDIEQSTDEMDNSKLEEKLSTPKRSLRNRNKTEDLDMSTSSSKLDDSMASNPSTPRQNKSVSDKDGDKALNESVKSANLTPKQVQKKLELAKKKEEKDKEKLEREKKRQQEKEERARQRQEKEEQRKREREEKEEAKRKEKEEKEEQKRKEREEREKLKEIEKKVKEMKEEQKKKEREDKEEQRRKEKEARDEERRKKQEALELEKQEQELKKKKAAEAFVNFFVPKQKVERESSVGPISKNSMLSSFTIKVDMRLAPTTRTNLTDEQRDELDKFLLEQSAGDLYLKCLKDGSAKPLSSGKTWPLDDKDDDVVVVEDELPPIDIAGEVITCESAPREKLRPKLLSFHENRRPPYWGTWRKKSKFVKPRKPFGQEKQLDYEVDSDDDWEDEADGESLDGSAGGSEDEGGADDYEVDNEVFVPHGYLSDEEATMDEDDVLSLSPETQKAKLKHLEDEFESELKKPTEKLKPRLYGLLYENTEGGKPEKCVDALWNYFEKFAMIMNDPAPLLQPSQEIEESEKKKIKKKKVLAEVNDQSQKSEKKKKTESKESKKPKPESKKALPNQPGINTFLKKVNST